MNADRDTAGAPFSRARMTGPARVLWLAIAAMALTGVHHVYGGMVYATPWRHHAAILAVPIIIALALAYGIYRQAPGSAGGDLAFRLFVLLTLLFPVLLVGFVEGGYNHVVKNVVYFAGAPDSFGRLFPSPPYEPPDDLLFELSGVLQFVLALLLVRHLLRLRRTGD